MRELGAGEQGHLRPSQLTHWRWSQSAQHGKRLADSDDSCDVLGSELGRCAGLALAPGHLLDGHNNVAASLRGGEKDGGGRGQTPRKQPTSMADIARHKLLPAPLAFHTTVQRPSGLALALPLAIALQRAPAR